MGSCNCVCGGRYEEKDVDDWSSGLDRFYSRHNGLGTGITSRFFSGKHLSRVSPLIDS